MSEKSILILGEADVGKTHYAAQLMIRLEEGKGAARCFAPADNLQPFADAMRDLNDGKAASHTSGSTTKQSVLHIEFPGSVRADVAWPEYAGERLKDLVHSRHAGDGWRKSAVDSAAWLLMLRHDALKNSRDLLNRPVAEWMDNRKKETVNNVDWSPQSRAIELLQMMLFLRRSVDDRMLALPRLAIALSCYDTFPNRDKFEKPLEALTEIAPLVAAFVAANWAINEHFVIGLSSTGRTLDKAKPDDEFIETGPATNGWVIKPDGLLTSDLTWPLVELIRD